MARTIICRDEGLLGRMIWDTFMSNYRAEGGQLSESEIASVIGPALADWVARKEAWCEIQHDLHLPKEELAERYEAQYLAEIERLIRSDDD